MITQYRGFEARHTGVLAAAQKANLISARDAYTQFQVAEEAAIFEAAQVRDVNDNS